MQGIRNDDQSLSPVTPLISLLFYNLLVDYLLYPVSTIYGVRSCVSYQKTGTQRPGHNAGVYYRMVRGEYHSRGNRGGAVVSDDRRLATAERSEENRQS